MRIILRAVFTKRSKLDNVREQVRLLWWKQKNRSKSARRNKYFLFLAGKIDKSNASRGSPFLNRTEQLESVTRGSTLLLRDHPAFRNIIPYLTPNTPYKKKALKRGNASPFPLREGSFVVFSSLSVPRVKSFPRTSFPYVSCGFRPYRLLLRALLAPRGRVLASSLAR